MSKIVLSIDVGYGNVKAAWGAESSTDTEIIFRSIANPVSKSSNSAVTISKGRVPIVVDGDTFMVGPDSYLSAGTSIPDFDYVARKEYVAFLRGAMHFIFCKTGVYHKIDVLSVGLPVGNFESQQDALIKICKGEHEIPTPLAFVQALGPTVKVMVEKVMVVPQPIGALSVFARKCARSNRSMGSALIIDPGFKTLDWVFSNGMSVDMERSGSFAGGMSALLRETSGIVGKKLGVGYIDLIEVEKALSSGKIFAGGRHHDFTPYSGIVKEAAAKVIDKFFGALDIDREFNSIVLTGGGGKYYLDAIAKKFPGHIIECADDAVMDNARGFYLVARGVMP
jgi:plasmid segregation protein ParM